MLASCGEGGAPPQKKLRMGGFVSDQTNIYTRAGRDKVETSS